MVKIRIPILYSTMYIMLTNICDLYRMGFVIANDQVISV